MLFTHMCVKHMRVKAYPIRVKRPTINRMRTIKEAMGIAIRDLRAAAKLTQIQLTEKAELGQTAVSRIEAGLQGVSTESLIRIASALGVEVSAIWAQTESLRSGDSAKTSTRAPATQDDRASPELTASRLRNDIAVLEHAVTSLFAVIGATRPAEGEKIAEHMKEGADPKFLQKDGSLRILLQVLEASARQAKARKAARPPAKPGSGPKRS